MRCSETKEKSPEPAFSSPERIPPAATPPPELAQASAQILRFARQRSLWQSWILHFLLLVWTAGLAGSVRAQNVPSVPDAAVQGAADADLAFFEKRIRPILAQRCYECHSARADRMEGGLRLDLQKARLEGGESGPAILPGDAPQSLLMRAVRYRDPELQMPPGGRLPDEEIEVLAGWIGRGAPAPADDAEVEYVHPSDPVAGRRHWAFLPLQAVQPPEVHQKGWVRSEIDQWILAQLEQQGLTPVPDASPAQLMRRISFQLTGLPPSVSHMSSYQQDSSPENLALIVDELLASPEFGRRWGRHWLDLARYADSNGLDENFLFREAWRYRNWVIDAVNADLPFDRFLLEQLAGDLLPFDSVVQRDQQRIAAGFLVMGPKVLLGVDPRRQRMDVADEQIDTIGRAVLGQTLGCARCHDHKFDPIPTADYYALAGIFTSTSVMERRFMLNEQRVMERLQGIGDDGDALDDAYEAWWRLPPDQRKTQGTPPAIPPRAMIPADAEQISDERIRRSGHFDAPTDTVPRGFLTVLNAGNVPQLPVDQSGRIQLAQWLTNADSPSGWLTARVQVNRVWHHLMGRGIVRTVDNFGRTGEPASHPELLDCLARQYIRDGWSLKSLIRKVVLSHVFLLNSLHHPENHERDPDNRLLWRAHRRRLDPESLRDAMLQAAGTLDLQSVGSTVDYLGDQATAVGANLVRRKTDFPFRSVYLPVIRNDLPELFEVFDFVNPHLSTGARPQTTVPAQGLFLLNDPMVMTLAETTARRIAGEPPQPLTAALVDQLFLQTTSSLPDETERMAVLTYLQEMDSRLQAVGEPEPQMRAITLACHAIFASSRFQFLD